MLTHNEVWKRHLHAYSLPLFLLLLALIGQGLGWKESLQYQRQAVLEGEIWRLWTAHLVHLSWRHYWLNAAGLVLVWLLFGQLLAVAVWCRHFIVTGFCISAGFLLLNPELVWYVGLSGVLHAAFMIGLLAGARGQLRFTLLVLLIFVGKIIFEQISGPLPGSTRAAGGPVVVAAHLYGAIAGALSYAIQYGFQKLK
ncbi:MAG TPA: rhombosortase [Gammaproteobacteria bacterium]